MPQVAADVPARVVPTAIVSDRHEFFVMIGVAEGTRTPAGGYTKAYYGHRDPGDGNLNRGTCQAGVGQVLPRRWLIANGWLGLRECSKGCGHS